MSATLALMWDQLVTLLDQLAASPWLPAAVFAFVMLDAVIPVFPSETAVIGGGVAAGIGDQSLALVLIAAVAGAFIGDWIAYWLGRSAHGWLSRRSRKLRERIEWAHTELRSRGARLLITARFVPLGRTAVTVASGVTRQPWFRYGVLIGLAALVWAAFGAGLGFVFGEAFSDRRFMAFVVAFAAAVGINAAAEAVRRVASPA